MDKAWTQDDGIPVACGDCGAHFKLDPAGDIAGAACSECGGTRFFRNQPSPTQSDGTLRDMVDSDSQKDQGGNPLGEGVIMGRDGERPLKKRDNYMHSNVQLSHRAMRPETLNMEPYAPLWSDEWVRQASIFDDAFNAVKDVGKAAIAPAEGVVNGVGDVAKGVGDIAGGHLTQGLGQMGQGVLAPAKGLVNNVKDIGEGAGQLAKNPVVDAAGLAAANLIPGVGEAADAAALGAGAADAAGAAGAAEGAGAAGEAAAGAGGDAASKAAPSLMKSVLNQGQGLYNNPYVKGLAGAHMLDSAGKEVDNLTGQGQPSDPSASAPDTSAIPTPGAAAPMAPGLQPYGSTKDIPFLLTADLETPHSVKSVDEQHDDPEEQDQQEFDDGDKSPSNVRNPNNEDSGASGEDGVRQDTPGYGFGPNSPGIERLNMLAPLLLHYLSNGIDGSQDPLILGLHETLDRENPGYLDREDPAGPSIVEMMLHQHKNRKPDKDTHASKVADAMPSGLPAVPTPTGGARCPRCGAPLSADGTCPSCGFKITPQGGSISPTSNPGAAPTAPGAAHAHVIANHQGPTTPEQIAAVQQYLMKHPHLKDMVPDVPLHPENYARILDEIQGNKNVVPQVDMSQGVSLPPEAQENPQGAMPMPDPSQPGGGMQQPMQPIAHVAKTPYDDLARYRDISPHVQHQVQDKLRHEGPDAALAFLQANNIQPTDEPYWAPDSVPTFAHKTADANNAVPRCPHCNSATTSVAQVGDNTGDGSSNDTGFCHGCQKTFKIAHKYVADANNAVPRCKHCGSASTRVQDVGDNTGEGTDLHAICTHCGNTWKVSAHTKVALVNPVLENAADRTAERPEDANSSLIWKDSHGKPLVEGGIYSMKTPGFNVTDDVQVIGSPKPSEINLKIVGQMTNNPDPHSPDIRITADQMVTKQYEFEPLQSSSEQDEQPLGGTPGLEHIPQAEPTTDEVSDSYPHRGTSISGVLAATGEKQMEMDEDVCHHCGNTWIEHTASSPTRTMHECARCGSAWETEDSEFGHEASTDLSWIMNSSSQDDDFWSGYERVRGMKEQMNGMGSRSLSSVAAKDSRLQAIHDLLENEHEARNQRLAGRHYSPSEQRALINERGRARNSDLLDLSNTHYEARFDPTGKSNGDNAPDEHLVLGL